MGFPACCSITPGCSAFPFSLGKCPQDTAQKLSCQQMLPSLPSFLSSQAVEPPLLSAPSSCLCLHYVLITSFCDCVCFYFLSHSLGCSYRRGRGNLDTLPEMCPGFSFVDPTAAEHGTEPTKRNITQQSRHWLSHSVNNSGQKIFEECTRGSGNIFWEVMTFIRVKHHKLLGLDTY